MLWFGQHEGELTGWLVCFPELGEEYCPPSQYLLPVLESDGGRQSSDCLDGLDEAWQVQLSLVECVEDTNTSFFDTFMDFCVRYYKCLSVFPLFLLQNKFSDYEKRKVGDKTFLIFLQHLLIT